MAVPLNIRGFAKDIPGHSLQLTQQTPYSEEYNCSCGHCHIYSSRPRQDGKAGARALRNWSDHLDLVNAPTDEATWVGTVEMTRASYDLLVAPSTYAGIQRYLDGTKKTYIKSWLSRGNMIWCVLKDTVTKSGRMSYSIVHAYSDNKSGAITAAAKELERARARGSKVTTDRAANGMGINPETVQMAPFSAAALVERAIAAADDHDTREAMAVLGELDELFTALPILQAMRARLHASLRVKVS